MEHALWPWFLTTLPTLKNGKTSLLLFSISSVIVSVCIQSVTKLSEQKYAFYGIVLKNADVSKLGCLIHKFSTKIRFFVNIVSS